MGILIFFFALLKLGGGILFPYPLTSILLKDSIEFEGYRKVETEGIVAESLYGWCRHPMQASTLLLLAFASNVYTVDRLIFIAVNFIGILIGIAMEEKRLSRKFTQYEGYKKKVPFRLIPFLF